MASQHPNIGQSWIDHNQHYNYPLMYNSHRKPNSAYAIQYQNFEDRLRGKKPLRNKLPTIMRKDSDALNTDDYL